MYVQALTFCWIRGYREGVGVCICAHESITVLQCFAVYCC